MRRAIVSYKVRPETASENEELIRGVFDELAVADPKGVRYSAFVLDDGVSFVHVVEHEGDNPIPELAAFKRYSEAVRERCAEPPVVAEAREIGAFDRLA
jgi:hypothetical protein